MTMFWKRNETPLAPVAAVNSAVEVISGGRWTAATVTDLNAEYKRGLGWRWCYGVSLDRNGVLVNRYEYNLRTKEN